MKWFFILFVLLNSIPVRAIENSLIKKTCHWNVETETQLIERTIQFIFSPYSEEVIQFKFMNCNQSAIHKRSERFFFGGSGDALWFEFSCGDLSYFVVYGESENNLTLSKTSPSEDFEDPILAQCDSDENLN